MIITSQDEKLAKIINRGDFFEDEFLDTVKNILSDIKTSGDSALIKYTNLFDWGEASLNNIEVTQHEINAALENLPKHQIDMLLEAEKRIRSFHEKQLEKTWTYYDDGIMLGQKVTALEKIGVYVPGGKAIYPSSVLMNIVPAKVAGVKEIYMVTPAAKGVVNPVVIAAAHIAGVTKIFKIGGAQAIGALAYGTDTIPKVDKITGPGNIYVALAKKTVFGTVDIDMIAGPSEILVIADHTANPVWVASDMLSQCEHDELASAIAITTNLATAKKIEKELYKQLKSMPKKSIAEKSLKDYSAIIVVDDMTQACDIANKIAPEHLELCVESPLEVVRRINNAGAIFMGHFTPESVGDYFAGPNHVLPTSGTARFFSPLGVYDFMKRTSLIYYTEEKLREHCNYIVDMAESEGLYAHAKAAKIRFE